MAKKIKIYRLMVFSGIGHQKLFEREIDAHATYEETYANKANKPRYRVEQVELYCEPTTLTEV